MIESDRDFASWLCDSDATRIQMLDACVEIRRKLLELIDSGLDPISRALIRERWVARLELIEAKAAWLEALTRDRRGADEG